MPETPNQNERMNPSAIVEQLMDRLRARGMSVHEIRPEVVAWVAVWLLVRWAEHEDRERQAVAEFDGQEYIPLFKGHGCLQECWETETALRSWAYESLYNRLAESDNNPLRVRLRQALDNEQMRGVVDQMIGSDEAHRWLESFIVPIDFSKPEHAHDALLLLDTLLSKSVGRTNSVGRTYSGEFYTPTAVTELMVELAEPKPGDRVYDPCFGTGGLLVQACRRIREAAHSSSPAEWERLRRQTIFGVERNQLAYTIGMTRIVLAGISEPGLELGDSLERPLQSGPERFDVVLACPPWGYTGRLEQSESSRYRHLPIRSRDLTNLFIQHAMQGLRPGGRAVIAVPESTLFSTGSDKKLRERLLYDFNVEGIVSLPAGTFTPFTGIKSNLLVFRRSRSTYKVRFLTVKRLAGSQGRQSKADELPGEIASRFRSDSFDESLWETTVGDLRTREYELVAKRSGEEQLVKWLRATRNAYPSLPLQSLDKVTAIFTGVSYDKNLTADEATSPDAVGLVRVSDLREGGVAGPGLFVRSAALARVKDSQRLQHGDLLLSISGTIGKIGVASITPGVSQCAAAKSVAIIRPLTSQVLPNYLAAILQSPVYQEWMSGHARGSAIQHLSVRTLRHLEVPVPELLLQERVVRDWQQVKGSDALTCLTRVLAGGDAPKTKALERVAETERLTATASSVERDVDPLTALDKMASTIVGSKLEEDSEGLVPWWDVWAKGMKLSLTALMGISDIQPSPALYAMLQDCRNRLEGVERSLPDHTTVSVQPVEEQLLKQARSFATAARMTAERAIESLLSRTDIRFGLPKATIVVGEREALTVQVTNAGPLPLRNVMIRTRPDVGRSTIAYLTESADTSFSADIPAQASPGKFTFLANWQATRLDGATADGEVSLAVEVQTTRQAVHDTDLRASPYITGDPVHPSRQDMFIGREELVAKIKRQLSNTRGANTILLEGNRRTGKTSILYHLMSDDILSGWLPVYCSFQGGTGDAKRTGLPTAQVFRTIARAVFETAFKAGIRTWMPGSTWPVASDLAIKAAFLRELQTAITEDSPFEAFDLYLQSVLEAISPRRLLLMLDEFDKLQDGIENGVTSPQVPENLRYLLHRSANLAAIFAYSKQLRSLREQYWSALFGLGYPISVGSLSQDDAGRLVTHPVQGRLVYADDARDRICTLCACQPFLIQNLCNRVFEAAAETQQRTVTLSMVDVAAGAMAGDNEHFHFATLWKDEVRSERQRYLLALCQQLADGPDAITLKLLEIKLEESGVVVRGSRQLGEDLRELRDLDLLTMHSNGSRYSLAIPLMAMWIQKNVDVEDQRRKAVQESQE